MNILLITYPHVVPNCSCFIVRQNIHYILFHTMKVVFAFWFKMPDGLTSINCMWHNQLVVSNLKVQKRFENYCEGEDYQWRTTINNNLVLLITQRYLCMASEDLNMELYIKKKMVVVVLFVLSGAQNQKQKIKSEPFLSFSDNPRLLRSCRWSRAWPQHAMMFTQINILWPWHITCPQANKLWPWQNSSQPNMLHIRLCFQHDINAIWGFINVYPYPNPKLTLTTIHIQCWCYGSRVCNT